MATNAELKALVQADIRDKTAPNSILKTDVAGALDAGFDYTDQQTEKGYNELCFFLNVSGTTATASYKKNDFSEETITLTVPSNGRIRIASTGNIFTDGETKILPIIFDNGGDMYFGVPIFEALPLWVEIDLRKFDNTQVSTPSVNGLLVEIRVYD